LEPDLAELYNDGVLPPPDLTGEPARLQRPGWQPTSAQVQAARQQLGWSLGLLIFLIGACLLVFALLLGWLPS